MTPTERDAAILRLLDDMNARLAQVSVETEQHKQQHEWIELAIKREAQSFALRQAIIEKTLTGLIWAGIVGLGVIMMTYLEAHGWKR